MDDKLIKKVRIALAVLIALIIMSFIFVVINVSNTEKNDRETRLRYSAQLVDNAVIDSFIRPITVAKVMGEDIPLKETLKKAGSDSKSVENDMINYLTALKNGLGYKMMFAVCDKSGAYFTCDGISYFMDNIYEGNSAWYGAFLDSGKNWDLDVDVEESKDWALSVFVNQLIVDEDKNVLGVCGTAVEMTQLQTLFEKYERVYNVKIDVTDETGLIQIDTDAQKIERDYVVLPDLNTISDGEYYYEKSADGDRVISYMEDIDMYLVVTNKTTQSSDVLSEVKIPLIISLITLLIATMTAYFVGK